MINDKDIGQTEIVTSGSINNINVIIEKGFNPVPHDTIFLDISDDGRIYDNGSRILRTVGISYPFEDVSSQLNENDAYVYVKNIPFGGDDNTINIVFAKSISKEKAATHKNGNIALREVVGLGKHNKYWYPIFSAGLNEETFLENFSETISTISNIKDFTTANKKPITITIALTKDLSNTVLEGLINHFTEAVKTSDIKDIIIKAKNQNIWHLILEDEIANKVSLSSEIPNSSYIVNHIENVTKKYNNWLEQESNKTEIKSLNKIENGDLFVFTNLNQNKKLSDEYIHIFEFYIEQLKDKNDIDTFFNSYNLKIEHREKFENANKNIFSRFNELSNNYGITQLDYNVFIDIVASTEYWELIGPLTTQNTETDTTINNPLSTAGISNDSAFAEKDLLGFENDIRAFAAIMAHKDTKPPLAIALFGDWGSGKSFFMHHLQKTISFLSEYQKFPGNANPEEEDNELKEPFCKGIVQIPFNAWSYMDSNLWAGLVVNIFEKLDNFITSSSKSNEAKIAVQNKLSNKLSIVTKEKADLETEIGKLDRDRETITTAFNKLKNEKSELYNEVVKKNIDDLIKEAKKEVNVLTDDIKKKLAEQGFTSEKIAELSPSALYEEYTSWLTFVKNLGQFKPLRLLTFIIIVITFLIVLIDPGNYIAGTFTFLNIKIVGLIGFFAPFTVKFFSTYNQFKKLYKPVSEYKNRFNKTFEEVRLDYEKDLATMNSQILQKENQIKEKELELEKVDRKIDDVNYALEHSITKRAFFNFISEKAHDEGYKKHMGLISVIRQDFEVLSDLFQEVTLSDDTSKKLERVENEVKDKILDESSDVQSKLQKVDMLDELDEDEKNELKKKIESDDFRKNFEKPLDRIILYIDDLDRCPDDKVMEVLQAVHLLMAFPLFIVVVGVDKRCVTNALFLRNLVQYSKYTESKNPEELKKFGIKIIEPHEYLEKIFQIPFHLKEPKNAKINNLIDDLLKGQLSEPAIDEQMTIERRKSEKNKSGVIADRENQKSDIDGETSDDQTESSKHDLAASSSGESKKEESQTAVIRPKHLKITKTEAEYLKNISWLVGTSPRTIKRFINMYRIIRAHEQLRYDSRESDKNFMGIMFILGLAIGQYKKHAADIFSKIVADPDNELSHHLDGRKNADFKSIKTQLSKDEEMKRLLDFKKEDFKQYIPFIRRFSFGADDANLSEDVKETAK